MDYIMVIILSYNKNIKLNLYTQLTNQNSKLQQLKSKMKKQNVQYQKRKLIYQKRIKQQAIQNKNVFQLPLQMRTKISVQQQKKVKQAFYIQSTWNIGTSCYTLSRSQLVSLIRSLGIVSKTSSLYQSFQYYKSSTIGWNQFLKIYINVRTQKGAYNQLAIALDLLAKQYKGDWRYLQDDLIKIGDVLTHDQIQIFYQQIIGNQPMTEDVLLNTLLGYK